jgi:hypothetical protein
MSASDNSDVVEVPEKFTAQVMDENNQPLITTPDTEEHLEILSKGDTEESRSWWASLWLRLIRKLKNVKH